MRKTTSILVCLLMLVPIRSEQSPFRNPDRMRVLPPLVLWAWERPEGLRFINPQSTAVAFLAGTIHIHGDDVAIRPRFQSLLVHDRAKLVAVIRIEADRDAAFDRSQIEQAAAAIAKQALPTNWNQFPERRFFEQTMLESLYFALGPRCQR